ncbi:hypothetical protein HFO56_39440 [Rhizobium laguerreae]|uniref:hypothetical protein n=1 Tax=Rhizobium laguerreae TaxID=1076926 RepID=UPI001C914EA5|nr:hypothetical protein [Rhizobium laguerreae]MBY3158375.1 hypothetical protein [Rhizobium laguerreae]
MKRISMPVVFGAFAALLPLSAVAAECDFDKAVGSCTGSVKILSSSGSKPSYSAEIQVSSSAPSCSKVEYYLDNTPNVTILKSDNSEQESLFGTKPISKKNISVRHCTVYASVGDGAKQPATSKQPQGEDPMECLKRFKVYQAYQEKHKLGWMGLMQYCP